MAEFPRNFNQGKISKASVEDIESNSPEEYYKEVDAKIESGLPTFKILNVERVDNGFIVQFYMDKELKAVIDYNWGKLYAESSEIFIIKSEEAINFIVNGRRFFSLDDAQDILLKLYYKN